MADHNKPLYQHITRDLSGRIIGTAYVYDHMQDGQADGILREFPDAVIRAYGGNKVEVFLPVPDPTGSP